MSDGTDRPDWIGYDITSGILRGYPNLTYTPAYLNLKFTAYDPNSGTYSYYKTLLVDCAPET